MTYLTFDSIFIWTYTWIAFWTILCAGVMVRRTGKNASDWEVIGFRFLIGLLCGAVAIRFYFDPQRAVILANPFTVFIALCLVGLSYFAMKTTVRVINIVRHSGWSHDQRREDVYYPNDETPDEAVERRHQEIVDTIPDAGRRVFIDRS